MDEQEEQVRRAIGTLLQSDPLIKLLQEVRLGRMKATDPGLRAVTESWIGVYAQVLEVPAGPCRLIASAGSSAPASGAGRYGCVVVGPSWNKRPSRPLSAGVGTRRLSP